MRFYEVIQKLGINISYRFCTRKLVKLLYANGYQISLWTVNDEKGMRKYAKLNPDNIATRHPGLMRQVKAGFLA